MDGDQTGEFLNKLRITQEDLRRSYSFTSSTILDPMIISIISLLELESNIRNWIILEDLFFILLGIEGTFIEYHENFSPDDPFGKTSRRSILNR
ncbi:hypothetical protein Pst134EA_032943 [Puccinia striiformis f. sp. tritici]|uniref:uncharacterized protein n=1 Tax=Puccinia striiformis f. sp. tritici TaxID=168172 RepID=UPI0020085E16|nr:uncharacterized protein Pst134EA_032943 [Puccinia striiformis f. sp. tritici]KAH9441508.1 hypothetical protein Pst134EA_032943 [Puccinia striiformis f. sp. tritici]